MKLWAESSLFRRCVVLRSSLLLQDFPCFVSTWLPVKWWGVDSSLDLTGTWPGVIPLPYYKAQCLMVIRTSSMLRVYMMFNLPFIWMQTHYQEVVGFRKVFLKVWWTRFQFNSSWMNNIAKMFINYGVLLIQAINTWDLLMFLKHT